MKLTKIVATLSFVTFYSTNLFSNSLSGLWIDETCWEEGETSIKQSEEYTFSSDKKGTVKFMQEAYSTKDCTGEKEVRGIDLSFLIGEPDSEGNFSIDIGDEGDDSFTQYTTYNVKKVAEKFNLYRANYDEETKCQDKEKRCTEIDFELPPLVKM